MKRTTKKCPNCEKEITLYKFTSHQNTKSCEKNKRDNIALEFAIIDSDNYTCNKCYKTFDKIGKFKNHYWTKHHYIEKENWKPQGFTSDKFQAYMQTSTYKNEQSERMIEIVKNNPDSYSANNVCGRVKIIEFNGDKFHGGWELLVAKYLYKNKIKYDRDVEPFEYMWEDSIHLYFPDFYIPSLDKYIEVKGYEREKDRAKWAVVDNLIILKQKEIDEIKSDCFIL